MEKWYNMSYQQIKEIEDYSIKREYLIKHREIFVHFVNPLYSSLSKSKQNEFDVDLGSAIKTILKRLMELNGGKEQSMKILLSRVKK